jgi:Tfp pilus assembly protein PilO
MTGRDRFVLMGVIVLAVLGAGWMLVVSPERKQAAEQSTQLAAAETQLSSAEGQLSGARAAQAKYASAYASIVSLGKAVPASQEVSSLIYELSVAADRKNVNFTSIASGSGSGSSSSSTAAVSATPSAFTQMPFTFIFDGSFFQLERLFSQLDHFTSRTNTGALEVSGRLLTIQSVKLTPASEGVQGAGGKLAGTISATAYELPGGQGLTGPATPGSPTGAATTAPATTGAASSPTAPAIARVTP